MVCWEGNVAKGDRERVWTKLERVCRGRTLESVSTDQD